MYLSFGLPCVHNIIFFSFQKSNRNEVIIFGLTRFCTKSHLQEYFSSVGKVVHCHMARNNERYSIVRYSSHEEASNAVQTLNGCEFEVSNPCEMKHVIEVELKSETITDKNNDVICTHEK